MSLAKKISDDVKSALKGGDKKKLSIARYVYSELKNFLIKENLDRDVLKLSDENIIKIGLLFGGFAERKLYEVRVGPAEDANVVIVDPTDPRMIFSEDAILKDYTKPLKMKSGINTDNATPENDFRRRSDGEIRKDRDAKLKQSDGRIAEDMPEDVKTKWEGYRQKLRDIPQDWAAVPNHLIRWPKDPDGEYDDPYPRNEDPEHKVILVAKRTAKDNAAIAQLTPIAGIDE